MTKKVRIGAVPSPAGRFASSRHWSQRSCFLLDKPCKMEESRAYQHQKLAPLGRSSLDKLNFQDEYMLSLWAYTHRQELARPRTHEGARAMSAEFVRTYNAQAHEITNAITAVVINAHAGLQLLRAQSPDLEVVRQALNNIANDGKRAGDIVVRTRALMNKVVAADGVADPLS